MQQEAESVLSTPAGDSEDAQQLRQLENRLDKAIIKNNETSHIRKTYEVILQKLQEVRDLHGRAIVVSFPDHTLLPARGCGLGTRLVQL